jgi:hypothetical protein
VDLVRFAEEHDVLEFFGGILHSDEPWAIATQQALLAGDFVAYLVKQCEELESARHYGGRSLYIAGLFQIIQLTADSAVLGPVIRVPHVVRMLFRPFPDVPPGVKAIRWQAIHSLLVAENRDEFKDTVLPEAAEELAELGPNLWEHQLVIIGLFMKMAIMSVSAAQSLVDRNFVNVLKVTMENFPNHTIAHRMIGRWLIIAHESDIIAPHILETMLPLIADMALDRAARIRRTNVIDILIKLSEAAQRSGVLSASLEHFIKDHPCWEEVAATISAFGWHTERCK